MKTLVHGIMRDLNQEMQDYRAKEQRLKEVVDRARELDIMRTCAKYELESDEFLTREQKAERIIRRERS